MKKLIIILSVILLWGCEKKEITPSVSSIKNNGLSKATLIMSGGITDTIVYKITNDASTEILTAFKCFNWPGANRTLTSIIGQINPYMYNEIQCYIPLDTIGAFSCNSCDEDEDGGISFKYGNWFGNLHNQDYLDKNIFTKGQISGEIVEYGKELDLASLTYLFDFTSDTLDTYLISGIISGNLYNDYYNFDFVFTFSALRQKNYYGISI